MPDHNDRFDGNNCFIICNPSGKKFHLYGDDPSEIEISDIANSLSKQCRFTGHLKVNAWYSSAEHCMLVSDLLARQGHSKHIQFVGLMHDATEAYLSDIAAPFKRELGNYYDREALIWTRLARKYDLPDVLPEAVREADWLALFIEARNMVATEEVIATWVGYEKYGEKSKEFPHKPFQLPPSAARASFLDCFVQLRGL